ncbi:MAG: 4Fe-4S dicluster domain-containing protein [Planctomycetes bacterium]|nr:4Fe-4S dicluster domain-containing protein [Planctomycetota bacterium]
MPSVNIIVKFCKGCGLCVGVCPKDCLEMSDKLGETGITPAVVKDESKCIACGDCATICPDAAIEILEDEPAKK